MRQVTRKSPANLDWIQKQGLLAVKLAQIFALRPDIISLEKCKQLQTLYSSASTIPTENVFKILKEKAPDSYHENISWFDVEPLAAASVGQVHKAKLKTGEKVVVKVIKEDHERKFKRDVKRMTRWLKLAMILSPKLRRVGNPIALLEHVQDYTLRELDLRNEIIGASKLNAIREELSGDFPMKRLRFPKYYPELSNRHVLVSELIDGQTLEQGIIKSNLAWEDLLELFRIHGAFMFGVGTFHGDLHPGNCILDKQGNFVFIDNGAICEAPRKVSNSLFNFFYHLSSNDKDLAFEALISLAERRPRSVKVEEFKKDMHEIYKDFENLSVGQQSLTEVMMKTVRSAVENAGADYGEEGFPIIRSLMYMDGLVIRTYPEVKLISEMTGSLNEFKSGLNLG
ncbi:MAG: AarF/ABC1/UbiB kinase family protein [Candidatus Thermoplasmatota archaeon]|jgi:ubiquinone biosynthesis protein|nr:AarF/ABC1/UbiB kinase family protein [Candidatus Thermoplasmatota archaeon]|tara:strand:- start:500 stop:1693 length:1194 start_codon:yes stop_codon:yes gene_type:complete